VGAAAGKTATPTARAENAAPEGIEILVACSLVKGAQLVLVQGEQVTGHLERAVELAGDQPQGDYLAGAPALWARSRRARNAGRAVLYGVWPAAAFAAASWPSISSAAPLPAAPA